MWKNIFFAILYRAACYKCTRKGNRCYKNLIFMLLVSITYRLSILKIK